MPGCTAAPDVLLMLTVKLLLPVPDAGDTTTNGSSEVAVQLTPLEANDRFTVCPPVMITSLPRTTPPNVSPERCVERVVADRYPRPCRRPPGRY